MEETVCATRKLEVEPVSLVL